MELWEILSANLFATVLLDVIFSLIFIIFGILAFAVIPKRPNWIMGYRTTRSAKNEETWAFAHKHFGKQMISCGLVFIALSITKVLLVNNEVSSWIIIGVIVAQIISVLLALIPTEIALRKEFDEDGVRRE